jgi:WD40 repeat protein
MKALILSEKAVLEGHTSTVRDVIFLGDKSDMIASSSDDGVRVWNYKTNKLVHHFPAKSTTYKLKYYDNIGFRGKKANVLLASCTDNYIKAYDINIFK